MIMTESGPLGEDSRTEAARQAFDEARSYVGGVLFQRMLADAQEDMQQGNGGSNFVIDAHQLNNNNPAMIFDIRPDEGVDFAIGDGAVHFLDMGQVLAQIESQSP